MQRNIRDRVSAPFRPIRPGTAPAPATVATEPEASSSKNPSVIFPTFSRTFSPTWQRPATATPEPPILRFILVMWERTSTIDDEVGLYGSTSEGNSVLLRIGNIGDSVEAKLLQFSTIEVQRNVCTELKSRISICQVELQAYWKDTKVTSILEASPQSLRTLFMDIECDCKAEIFPRADSEQVIQIGNIINLSVTRPPLHVIFTLNACRDVPGATVLTYTSELDMLEGWYNFVRWVDPDLIGGHNIKKFDLRYLKDRVDFLLAEKVQILGRRKFIGTTVIPITMTGNFSAPLKTFEILLSGRLVVDTRIISCTYSYVEAHSLQYLSETLLNSTKKDVLPVQIGQLIRGSPDEVKQLAEYCLHDVELSRRLFLWYIEAELSKRAYIASAEAMASVIRGHSKVVTVDHK
ncbi:MAG: DNA-directed DNA polymerase delta [Candelina mexicana]|nr:MAG: DNA-directed DNA polymerase delta [Candelina mexicana]